jgi:tetratricopeptide (TPR) repeat protein
VYRATDILLKRDVAIKVLQFTPSEEESQTRLMREALAAAQLNHPNIVTVYDAGETALPAGGRLVAYIVMELIDGKSLYEKRPEDIDQILTITRQLCDALDHAHSHGVIHRDLKPENVLLTNEGIAKLMDFGLARSGVSRLTQESTITGTLYYLAPEIALGRDYDERVDLYALGVMLYELVTGQPPFMADDPMALISQHLHAPVTPPRTLNSKISSDLESLVLQLLEKDLEDRPRKASDVVRILEQIEAGESPDKEILGSELPLLGRIVRDRLVGRGIELEKAMGEWQRVISGESRALVISGEPGIGKTRLAREIIKMIREGGVNSLSGGCYEFEATTPYLPVAEALRDWVNKQEPDTLKAQLGQTASELAKLAPEIEAKLGPQEANPPLSPQEERYRLFDYIARFFKNLADEQGLVLFVDDLHWADQGTYSLLTYLLRRLGKEKLLLLATYRDIELDRSHPMSVALVEWNRERRSTRIHLDRLSVAETNMLLATMFGLESVSDEFTHAIYRETEGNPFFIEEVIKSLIDQGQIYRVEDRWERIELTELTVPRSIQEAIERRLSTISSNCLEMLHSAAVLGKIFLYRELVVVSTISEDELLNTLDEAMTAQLISIGSDESFVFTHDKIREILYAEINPVRRRRLHKNIGEALEDLYAEKLNERVQDLAHHFVQSGDLEKGLEYSLLAAEKADHLSAYEEALKFYRDALDCAEKLNHVEDIAAVTEAIAEIYYQHGQYTAAVEHYQRAQEFVEEKAKQTALTAKIGMIYTETGDPRGHKILHSVLEELDPVTQSLELAQATMWLGRFLHFRAQYSEAIKLYEQAKRLSDPLDDPRTTASIYGLLAGAYQHMTLYKESMHWADQAISYSESKDYPWAVAVGHEFIAENYEFMGKWREALKAAEQDYKLGEEIGSLQRMIWGDFTRANALHGLGYLNDVLVIYQNVIDSAKRTGDWRLAILTATYLANLETDLGNDKNTRALAEEWIKKADESREVQLQARSRFMLAYLHIQRQEWAEALVYLKEMYQLTSETENRSMHLVTRAYQAEAYWGIGDYTRAEKVANQALAHARQADAPHHEAIALHVLGKICTARGEFAEAETIFREAIGIFERTGSRLGLGRALQNRAELFISQADLESAEMDYNRAIQIFEEIGAPCDLEKARADFNRVMGSGST